MENKLIARTVQDILDGKVTAANVVDKTYADRCLVGRILNAKFSEIPEVDSWHKKTIITNIVRLMLQPYRQVLLFQYMDKRYSIEEIYSMWISFLQNQFILV